MVGGTPTKPHVAVEVSASTPANEVVASIVASASAVPRGNTGNRWLIVTFFFVIIFASIVYFREEIYTFTKDVHKRPILSIAEALQVRQYLGSQWTFGTGEDAVKGLEAETDVFIPSNSTALLDALSPAP